MLKPWMEQFAIILQQPVQSEDPDNWSNKLEVGLSAISLFQITDYSLYIYHAHRLLTLSLFFL